MASTSATTNSQHKPGNSQKIDTSPRYPKVKYDCPKCSKWSSVKMKELIKYLKKHPPTDCMNRNSLYMCCYACNCYNIILIDRSNDWAPEFFRSFTKEGIISMCHRLRYPVPFNLPHISVDNDSGVEEY